MATKVGGMRMNMPREPSGWLVTERAAGESGAVLPTGPCTSDRALPLSALNGPMNAHAIDAFER